MGTFGIVVSLVWIVACAFVFGGAAPLGFVVFGGSPVVLWAIYRLARRLARKAPMYYGPL
jgi:hypothetical protein